VIRSYCKLEGTTDALVAWLQTQRAPATARVIKEALGWETRRFNQAVERAGYKRIDNDSGAPLAYRAK